MTEKSESKISKEIQKLSFEDAMEQLEEIVQKLESGDVKLEESIEIYTRGNELKAHCEAKLRDAQVKVEKLVVSKDGEVTTEPAEIE